MTKGNINFIIHWLVVLSPENFEAFKKEYGIGFRSEYCILDPLAYEVTQNNNKKTAVY